MTTYSMLCMKGAGGGGFYIYLDGGGLEVELDSRRSADPGLLPTPNISPLAKPRDTSSLLVGKSHFTSLRPVSGTKVTSLAQYSPQHLSLLSQMKICQLYWISWCPECSFITNIIDCHCYVIRMSIGVHHRMNTQLLPMTLTTMSSMLFGVPHDVDYKNI